MSKADEYCKRENIAGDAKRDKREAIKNYLEKKCEEDSALAEKYKAELMDKCLSFIKDVAHKWLGGRNGYIEDAIIYKWARDYFIDGYAEQEEKEAAEREAKQKVARAKRKEIEAEEKKTKAENKAAPETEESQKQEDEEAESDYSGDVLGSDADTKPAIVSKKPASSQLEQRSLFDFGDDNA